MSAWEPVWTELGGTRSFMESLPFWEMYPHNELIKSGKAFCLAKPGEVYAFYLPSGGDITIELITDATYKYEWWKPTNGKNGRFQSTGSISGGQQVLKSPGQGDWAARIIKQ